VRTYEMGDITARLEIGLGPFHRMVAAMLLLTALVHLGFALRDARRAAAGSPATHPSQGG
jgi:heme A synthase